MSKHDLLMEYEVIRFMRENGINISKLAQESGYTIWELRGACSSGGLGVGAMGNAIRDALARIAKKDVPGDRFQNYPIHGYEVTIRNKGGSRKRKYNMFCLEDLSNDNGLVYDYVKRIYGGYTEDITPVSDI